MTDNQKEPEAKPKKKGSRLMKKAFIVGGILALMLTFLTIYSSLVVSRIRADLTSFQDKFSRISASFQSQDFNQVIGEFNNLEGDLASLEKNYQKLGYLKFVPYFNAFYRDGQHLLAGSKYMLNAGEIAIAALEPFFDLIGLGEEKEAEEEPITVEERLVMVLDTLDKISPQLDQISQELSKANEEVSQINPDRYPEELFGKKIRGNISSVVTMIDSSTQVVKGIKPIVSYLKPLLGVPEKKTYFLLFQNEAELRPSGGFMTAYAFLTVHNGKFTPLSSYDIYAADNRFGNRLKAPEPILDYLPNVNYWHLRDMNLSPDFSESMKVFWENYRLVSTTSDIDGIIAVDTKVLVELLRILGEIGVSGWGNFSAEDDPRCNCPQVFYELELYADKPVSAARQERKGIIGPLMHSILGNIMGSPRKKWPEFINVALAMIREKHFLFYFFDDDLQGAIETLNAGGRIKEFTGDYFHLNDCNFAGAKSNMYIQENILQEIEIAQDGTVTKTVTIDYKNPAPPSNCNLEKGDLCLNGFNRNWFRLYVPQGSELLDSTGSEVAIKTYEELGKTVFEGFYGLTPGTSLKPEGKLRLTFKYRLPFKAVKGSDFALLIQKQPGTLNHQYEVHLSGQQKSFALDSDKELQFAF